MTDFFQVLNGGWAESRLGDFSVPIDEDETGDYDYSSDSDLERSGDSGRRLPRHSIFRKEVVNEHHGIGQIIKIPNIAFITYVLQIHTIILLTTVQIRGLSIVYV